jgi:hypothetical protein
MDRGRGDKEVMYNGVGSQDELTYIVHDPSLSICR